MKRNYLKRNDCIEEFKKKKKQQTTNSGFLILVLTLKEGSQFDSYKHKNAQKTEKKLHLQKKGIQNLKESTCLKLFPVQKDYHMGSEDQYTRRKEFNLLLSLTHSNNVTIIANIIV